MNSICDFAFAKIILSSPKMESPSISNFLYDLQKKSNVDFSCLIEFCNLMLPFMPNAEHKSLRKVCAQHFTAGSATAYEADIDKLCYSVIAKLKAGSINIDCVSDIEIPLFVGLIEQIFGIKLSHPIKFLFCIDDIASLVEPLRSVKQLESIQTSADYVYSYIEMLLDDNQLSKLSYKLANALNKQVSKAELIVLLITLITAAKALTETLSNIMILNSKSTNETKDKMKNKIWVKDNIGGILRFAASTQYLVRVSNLEHSLQNSNLIEGQQCLIDIPACNADKGFFKNINFETIDTEYEKKHLAFGAGNHKCIGRYIASLIICSFIPKFYSQFPYAYIDVNSLQYKKNKFAKKLYSGRMYLEGLNGN